MGPKSKLPKHVREYLSSGEYILFIVGTINIALVVDIIDSVYLSEDTN